MEYFLLGVYFSICIIWSGYSFTQEYYYDQKPNKLWYIITIVLLPSSVIMVALCIMFHTTKAVQCRCKFHEKIKEIWK